MIRTKIAAFALLFAIAFALGGAGLLYAQSQQEGVGMMSTMSMMRTCPMMQGATQGPGAALEHRNELGLTEEQVKKLRVLEEGVEQARTRMPEQMRQLHKDIRAATEGERFDEAAVRAAFDRMAELHADMAVVMLRARHDIRRILTPEQQGKMMELTREGMGMASMQGMRGMLEMMKHCPMMQGGMENSPADTSGGVHDEKENIR